MSVLKVKCYRASPPPNFDSFPVQHCDSGAMGVLNSATVSLRVAKHQPWSEDVQAFDRRERTSLSDTAKRHDSASFCRPLSQTGRGGSLSFSPSRPIYQKRHILEKQNYLRWTGAPIDSSKPHSWAWLLFPNIFVSFYQSANWLYSTVHRQSKSKYHMYIRPTMTGPPFWMWEGYKCTLWVWTLDSFHWW